MTFKYTTINPTTYKIQGRGCDCYLLEGSEEAILIDSGCAHENIKEYAKTLTKLPLTKVINTHSHFDHTGGNGYFETVYVTEKMSKTCKQNMDEDRDKYFYNYDFTFVYDKKIIPIKDRELLIIECDCHSPGNIVILDRKERLLFVGDELDQDQVLLLPGFAEKKGQFHSCPAATVSDYLVMLKMLKSYDMDYDLICTGHNGSPLDKKCIDIMIELCMGILDGSVESSLNCESDTYNKNDTHYPYINANYRRATHKGYSLVYCNDSLNKRSQNTINKPATPLHRMCADNYK